MSAIFSAEAKQPITTSSTASKASLMRMGITHWFYCIGVLTVENAGRTVKERRLRRDREVPPIHERIHLFIHKPARYHKEYAIVGGEHKKRASGKRHCRVETKGQIGFRDVFGL